MYTITSKNGTMYYETFSSDAANGYRQAIENATGYAEVYHGKELVYKTK